MSADRVFATAKPGEAFVFRHNFSENKWENVTSKKDGSATVTFRKRGTAFFIRVHPDGGEKEEHALSQTAQVKDSGEGFIQVPLPDKKQIIGIKFHSPEIAAIFLGKIRAEMSVLGAVAMQAVVLEEKPVGAMTMAPNPDLLPEAIGYSTGPSTLPTRAMTQPPPHGYHGNMVEAPGVGLQPLPRQPHPAPPSVVQPHPAPTSVVQPHLAQPSVVQPHLAQPSVVQPHPTQASLVRPHPAVHHAIQPRPPPVVQPHPPRAAVHRTQSAGEHQSQYGQPVRGPVVSPPGHMAPQTAPVKPTGNPGQLIGNPGPPVFNVGQPVANSGQPVNVVQFNSGQPVVDMGQLPQAKARAVAPEVRRPPPLRAELDTPSFIPNGEQSDPATFLANAINTANFEAAHKMLNLLQKIVEQKKPQRHVNISYCSSATGPSAEDEEVKLHLSIEFQSQHKRALQLYLDFKSSLRICDIQQHLELSHHIPKATQNWIIGDNLVKGDELNRTLREFGITGEGTTAKVFIYVMHSKKAHVPKEEYEAIRQCQQEEWERKNKHRFQQQQAPPTATPAAPPELPPRSRPAPQPSARPLPVVEPAQFGGGQGFEGHQTGVVAPPMAAVHYPPKAREATPPRRHAWGPPPGEEDTYSRVNHNIPVIAPPPERQQVDFDPAYEHLHGYQQRLGEVQPHPQQAPPTVSNYPRPPVGHYVQPLPAVAAMAQPPLQQPPPLHQQLVMGHTQESQGPPVQQYQAPPPEPQPRSKPLLQPRPGWSCPRCTFINKPRRPGCEVCSADRPPDYKIPEDLPMDEDEARIMAGLQGSDFMFQQFKAAEKQKEEEERQRNFQALIEAEQEALITNDVKFDCPVCFDTMEPGEGVVLRNCLHQFCKECLKETIKKCPDAEVKCPFIDNDYECNAPLPEREIKHLLSEEELQELYRRGLRQAESAAANSYHCKTTDCEGFCFYEDEVNDFKCPLCGKVNCLTCKAIHEGMDCQEYQEDLRRRAANDDAAKATQEMLEQMVEAGDAMHCPSCKIVVQKKDGCDWIRCSVCKTEICWATKQARWGPKGKGDKSGGCHCRENGKRCHPLCRNCH